MHLYRQRYWKIILIPRRFIDYHKVQRAGIDKKQKKALFFYRFIQQIADKCIPYTFFSNMIYGIGIIPKCLQCLLTFRWIYCLLNCNVSECDEVYNTSSRRSKPLLTVLIILILTQRRLLCAFECCEPQIYYYSNASSFRRRLRYYFF